MFIKAQFGVIQNLQMSPIAQTSFLQQTSSRACSPEETNVPICLVQLLHCTEDPRDTLRQQISHIGTPLEFKPYHTIGNQSKPLKKLFWNYWSMLKPVIHGSLVRKWPEAKILLFCLEESRCMIPKNNWEWLRQQSPPSCPEKSRTQNHISIGH